jgi:hypothetical protein
MLHEHYLDLLDRIDRQIAAFDEHPDEGVREQTAALLRNVDLLHREGLVRLVAALRADGAADRLERAVAADPVVRILLGLYGLAELDLPDEPPPAPAGSLGFFPAERLAVRRRGAGEGPR